jgi:hypothetical protein
MPACLTQKSMAWNGNSYVLKGIGRFPCLMRVKRSSSAAATMLPLRTKQAAES